jgi:hypothetical protein
MLVIRTEKKLHNQFMKHIRHIIAETEETTHLSASLNFVVSSDLPLNPLEAEKSNNLDLKV